MKLIVLGGRIGSGKSTVGRELARTLGCNRSSFSDVLRDIARVRGLSEDREVLMTLGQELVDSDARGFCLSVVDRLNLERQTVGVIEGVRHEVILTELRNLDPAWTVIFVFISVDDELQRERLASRQGTELSRIASYESHPTEVQVVSTLPDSADLVVSGLLALDAQVEEILSFVA